VHTVGNLTKGPRIAAPAAAVMCAALLTTMSPTVIASPRSEAVMRASHQYEQGVLGVHEYGAGERVVILIPGLVSGPWVWSQTIEKLAPHYRVLALTLPGFDGRPATSQRPLMQKTVADLAELIESRNLDQPVLVGHSLGGTLALAFATEHPDQISGVVALDGLPVFPSVANSSADEREEMAARAAEGFLRSCTDALACQTRYMEGTGTVDPERARMLAGKTAKSDMKAASQWVDELMRMDLRPQLARARVPILEVAPYNQEDAAPPFASAADKQRFYASLLEQAPDARVVVVENARHFLMQDQPEAWQRELDRFLAALPPE
jgi:pimeloyl-ACP methyl ester carboxylesterase